MPNDIEIGCFILPSNRLKLGHGSFSDVFLGREKLDPKRKVAIKTVKKKRLPIQTLKKELFVLKTLEKMNHPNLVDFLYFQESKNNFIFVTEYCNGGDFQNYLNAMKTLPEDHVSHFLGQIGNALDALQMINIVHRDLKPANILMTYNGDDIKKFTDINFKIADFGFAKVLAESDASTKTFCGTLLYMAPEVYQRLSYNYKADLWSLGIIIYQCITGIVPTATGFYSDICKYTGIRGMPFRMPSNISTDLQDVLCGLLMLDPDKRIAFEDFICHPFLKHVPHELPEMFVSACEYADAIVPSPTKLIASHKVQLHKSNHGACKDSNNLSLTFRGTAGNLGKVGVSNGGSLRGQRSQASNLGDDESQLSDEDDELDFKAIGRISEGNSTNSDRSNLPSDDKIEKSSVDRWRSRDLKASKTNTPRSFRVIYENVESSSEEEDTCYSLLCPFRNFF